LPEIEDSKYQIGYGIMVGFENKIIRVGSIRFMKMEGVAIPKKIEKAMAAHTEGHSFVMVGINDKVGGAIEIQPSIRPEVKNIISGLRQRGIKHIAIVSGDHKHPTQKLANSLGMDSYFYDILPEQKADIVEQLQKEGKSVCFVGDGINDAIAMQKAQVSISLRGASTLATDLAQVVFMDGTLSHLCDLFDISKNVEVNLQRSLKIALSPAVINVGGAFLLNLGFVTSLIVNQVIVFVGIGNAMLASKQIIHSKIKEV
jgi:Cu2+-exporting ATPase